MGDAYRRAPKTVSAKQKASERFTEVRNSKAYHNYFVGEKLEAGIVLKGTEVKSVRDGKAQITESFVRLDKGEPILYHAHIAEYSHGNLNNHEPLRPRKLLLNAKEIRKLRQEVEMGGQTIVPTRMYIKHGLVKVEIAVCRGKKLYDKREDFKKRTAMREAERALRRR